MSPDPFYQELKNSVLKGDKEKARELARQAVEKDLDLLECIEHGFGAGIREVGDLWEAGEYFLPELAQGAEVMKAAMEIFEPVLRQRRQSREVAGTVVIGTVEGDIHDIGKTLVAAFLEANGFQVFDLGKDVPLHRFIEKAEEVSADLLCMSALLTTTMIGQGRVVEALKEKGLHGRIAVLVGGAPVTPDYARKTGADGYGVNAVNALAEAKRIMEAR